MINALNSLLIVAQQILMEIAHHAMQDSSLTQPQETVLNYHQIVHKLTLKVIVPSVLLVTI